MVGVFAKIGEFFASLLWALFGAATKLAFAAILVLAVLAGLLFAIQYLLSRRRNRDR